MGINCEQGINPDEITVPVYFELKQNYPNPFNPSTNIEYNLFKPGVVSLIIYDNNGKVVTKLVNNIYQNYGKYILDWNGKNDIGTDVSSGIYFCRIIVNGSDLSNQSVNSYTRSMILLK
ncbi:MAG: T9SS type A sorting domain-containing protein [Ignavibacteria bacterium]|nr:T9SS type A sorting domain-containing protein [Ignavibacteria bacterium]